LEDLQTFFSSPTIGGLLALAALGLIFLVKEGVAAAREHVIPRLLEVSERRRKLTLPYADDVLDREWHEPEYFRDGDPKHVDFARGRVYIRPEVADAEISLRRGRFLHVVGPPSSGKSVIARTVAFRSPRPRDVLFFPRPAPVTDEFIDYLGTAAARRRFDKTQALCIVDDVHLDPLRCTRLFELVYTNFERLRLLFVSRPIASDVLLDSEVAFSFSPYMRTIDVRADDAVGALADFYSDQRFGYEAPTIARHQFVNECAGDLLLVGRYLREWDGRAEVNLDDLRAQVFKGVALDLERARNISPDAVTVNLVLGLFYRFEIPVEKRFIEGELGVDASELIRTGEVQAENDYLLLHHSSVAKLRSNVIERFRMPEYAHLSAKFSPFPAELFRRYVRVNPRNALEVVVQLRRAPELLKALTGDPAVQDVLRERLRDDHELNLVGWALLIIFTGDRKGFWEIVRDMDFATRADVNAHKVSGVHLSLFLHNLHRVSESKGAQWLGGVSPNLLATKLLGIPLRHFAHSLWRVNRMSRDVFNDVAAALDMAAVAAKLAEEQDLVVLREASSILNTLLVGRMAVRQRTRQDFAGEWTSLLSFFCERKRVERIFPGRIRGFPFAASTRQHHMHRKWILANCLPAVAVVVDRGAARAVAGKSSLFAVGVAGVKGDFERGDIVRVVDHDDQVVAVGITNVDSDALRKMKGRRSDDLRQLGLPSDRVFDNDRLVRGPLLEEWMEEDFQVVLPG
jgi:pseudouridine/archaeosine synthase-like protein